MMMMPDPGLMLSAINAMMAAVSVWQNERDFKRTRQEYDRVLEASQASEAIRQEAKVLSGLLPPAVLAKLGSRVDKCWADFLGEIDPEASSSNADEAEIILGECLCSELRRIKRLHGQLPQGQLRDWWNTYGCGPLIRG